MGKVEQKNMSHPIPGHVYGEDEVCGMCEGTGQTSDADGQAIECLCVKERRAETLPEPNQD